MTHYNNPEHKMDSGEICKWISDNILGYEKTFLKVTTIFGELKEVEIGKTLSALDKTKLTDKFPELKDKEIVEV